MKSKISLFNRHIFTLNLKRFWPLWTIVTAGGLIVPFAFLINRITIGRMDPYDTKEFFIVFLTDGSPVIALIYAIIAAMCVWGYLYNQRSISTYHSIPVTRKELFFTTFLSGLSIMLIPLIICGTIMVLLTSCIGAGAIKWALIAFLGTVGEFIVFFSVATFTVHLTGNIIALPIVYFAINFIAPALEALIQNFAERLVYGLLFDYRGYLRFLSPVMNLSFAVNAHRVKDSEGIIVVDGIENAYIIAIYTVAAILLSLVSYFLYSRRKSERTGYLAMFDIVRKAFHFIYTLLFATAISVVIYEILMIDNYYNIVYNPALFFIVEAVCVVVGYYTGYMIIEGTARVFKKKRLVGLAAWIVASLAVIILLSKDVFGIGSYIPDVSEISEATLMVDGGMFEMDSENDAELIEKLIETQRMVYADEPRVRSRDGMRYEVGTTYEYFRVNYILKNGKIYEREYQFAAKDTDFDDPASAVSAIKEYLQTPDLLYDMLKTKPGYTPSDCTIWVPDSDACDTLFRDDMYVMIDALLKDVEEGNLVAYDACTNIYDGAHARIDLYYISDEYVDNEFYYDSYGANVAISSKCTNVISALKELGYLSLAGAIEKTPLD